MFIFIQQSLNTDIEINQNCKSAFGQFTQKFEKHYQNDQEQEFAFNTFCKRFTELKELVKTCPTCAVTSIYDIPENKLITSKSKKLRKQSFFNNFVGVIDCNKEYCFAENTIPDLTQLPKSVDFRELGLTGKAKAQGGCGSCWAFATSAALESCLLRDKKHYTAPWHFSPSNISVSEQFILQNLRDFNSYCAGGDATVAFWQMAMEQQTIEIAANFPYAPSQSNNVPAEPKLHQDFYNKPFAEFPLHQEKTSSTGAIKIFLDEEKSFDQKSIATLKSFLARGFPVMASMHVRSHGAAFSSYKGESVFGANEKCGKFSADHQVIFMGYGKKNGKDVWIVKNSWGTGWGSQGFFYVEIGSNAFCIENYAFGVVPKHAEVVDEVFNGDGGVFDIKRGDKNALDMD